MTLLLSWMERFATAYLIGWLVWRGVSREQAVRMVQKESTVMTWEEKIESLVNLAKATGRFLNTETEPETDYSQDAHKRLHDAYKEFCDWRHDEPFVVDEIKQAIKNAPNHGGDTDKP